MHHYIQCFQSVSAGDSISHISDKDFPIDGLEVEGYEHLRNVRMLRAFYENPGTGVKPN
jgi:hypothetical protein